MFIAIVETKYRAVAIAETAAEAKRLAREKALEYLRENEEYWSETAEDVAEDYGYSLTELEVGSAELI